MQFPAPLQTAPPPAVAPMNGLAPTNQGAVLGGNLQPFDPYASPGGLNSGLTPGLGASPFGHTPPGFYSPYPPPGPNWQTPSGAVPYGVTPFPGGDAANVAPALPPGGIGPAYGQPTSPLQPPSSSMGTPFGGSADPYYRGSPYANPYGPSGATSYSGGTRPPYQRLFQDTGLRATYLFGRRNDDLSMTEVEASTTAFLANFLGVPSGLRVTPGFAFHWTEGPQGPGASHVPARLYSGYVDVGLEPQINQYVSAELSARVGVYTDFQAFNEDTIRLLGTGVGVIQTTPTVALKLGAAYIDRVDLKLLPAAGILWTPNQQTRWDLLFPAPKLSNYWTSIGNYQVWWYLGAEYGGGSWSIERKTQPPKNDRIDINDIRIYGGVEWWNLNRCYGFVEIGYVFDRELVFYRVPGDRMKLDDTFMVRGGISW